MSDSSLWIYLTGVLPAIFLIVFYGRGSPLKHIPGPSASRFTSLRHVYSIISKKLLEDYATWSREYGMFTLCKPSYRPNYIGVALFANTFITGELVRIEPNVLLTSSPDLVMRMSGVRSKYGKDPEFYLLARLAPGKENLASLTDESLHGRHKAKLAPAVGSFCDLYRSHQSLLNSCAVHAGCQWSQRTYHRRPPINTARIHSYDVSRNFHIHQNHGSSERNAIFHDKSNHRANFWTGL